MSAELEVVSKAIVDINAVSAGLAALSKQYSGVIYEITTIAGMEKAKLARLAIREPRYEVERIRKAAKAPILALGKKLDAEAARIEAALLQIEEPIDKQIKEEEGRKERERQAKIDEDMRRVTALQERVAELRGNQSLSASSGAQLIAEHIADLERIPVDESFGVFFQQAGYAKAAGLDRLRALHKAALEHEAEQARIKAEREELSRLRAEQLEREAMERKQREALAAEEREKTRREREAQEAETARLRAEQTAAAKAERDRISAEEARLAAERAEFQRQQEASRLARESEERERAEQARIASIKRPDDAELMSVLAKHYRVPDTKVREWLAATNWKKAKAA